MKFQHGQDGQVVGRLSTARTAKWLAVLGRPSLPRARFLAVLAVLAVLARPALTVDTQYGQYGQ